jgi:hypothetical protein
MSTFSFEYSAVINATPADVYAVFRDYKGSHAAILPKPAFESLTVLEGGMGAGTVFRADMNILGAKSTITMTVTEPEPKPGHLIVEEDAKAGLKTSFIFDPVENGQKTRVTLRTESVSKGGVTSLIERFVIVPVLRRVYKKELENLSAYLAAKK